MPTRFEYSYNTHIAQQIEDLTPDQIIALLEVSETLHPHAKRLHEVGLPAHFYLLRQAADALEATALAASPTLQAGEFP